MFALSQRDLDGFHDFLFGFDREHPNFRSPADRLPQWKHDGTPQVYSARPSTSASARRDRHVIRPSKPSGAAARSGRPQTSAVPKPATKEVEEDVAESMDTSEVELPPNRFFQATASEPRAEDKSHARGPEEDVPSNQRGIRSSYPSSSRKKHRRSPAVPAVVERLFPSNEVRRTVAGRRLLHWAEAAGIRCEVPEKIIACFGGFLRDPLRMARPWGKLCAHGRGYFQRCADRLILTVRPSGGEVHASAPAKGRRRAMIYTQREKHLQHMLSESSSLREYRQQQEYSRWCLWQLKHFYEQGFSYFPYVWTHGGNQEELIRIFSGKYVVPCSSFIAERVTEAVREKQRVLFFEHFLRDELGLAVGEEQEKDDVTEALRNTPIETYQDDGDDDSTQPYADVRLNPNSGLLEMSFYVGGDDGGEGAVYLSRSVAGCLDNYRWIVLDGLWKDELLHFVPKLSVGEPGVQESSDGSVSMRQGDPKWKTKVVGIHAMIAHGVCLQKVVQHPSAPSDSYLCSVCGQIRSYNPAYVSSKTGALTRGMHFCSICRKKTSHVRVPATFRGKLFRLESDLGRLTSRSAERSGRSVSASHANPSVHAEAALIKGYASFLESKGQPTSRWSSTTMVDKDEILRQTVSLSVGPPKPS